MQESVTWKSFSSSRFFISPARSLGVAGLRAVENRHFALDGSARTALALGADPSRR